MFFWNSFAFSIIQWILATLPSPYVNNCSTSHPIKGKTSEGMSLSLGWSTYAHLSLTWILTVMQGTCLHFALVLSMATSWPHLCFSVIIKPKCTFGKNTTDTHVLSCSVMSDSLWPHGLELARLLCLWGVRGSSRPRDWTQISCTAGRFFTSWVIVCLKKSDEHTPDIPVCTPIPLL